MSEAKAQLHQILAIEGDLAGAAKHIQAEAIKILGKSDRFLGVTRTLAMIDDARSNEEEAGFEHHEISTTVHEQLEYLAINLTRHWDATATKEATNQFAKADLIVDGKLIKANVPATALLGLETRLKDLRKVVACVPVLQAGTKWVPSDVPHVYAAEHPEVKMRTEKVTHPVVLHEGTKEHPPQVVQESKDVMTGNFTINKTSGMLAANEKKQLLERIDNMIRATKIARQQANCQEVVRLDIGKVIFDYLFER